MIPRECLDPIEFDVETTGFQAYSGVHYAFSFQFFDGAEGVFILFDPSDDSPEAQEARAEIQRWFDKAAKRGGLRAWNSKFDFAFAMEAGFELPPEDMWQDGMLEAHAINERRSVALKAIGQDLGLTGADNQKAIKAWLNNENKRRRAAAEASLATDEPHEFVPANYSDVPDELMEPYALEDVFLTRKIGDHHAMILANKPDLKRVVNFERESLASLFWIERRGLPADREGYIKLKFEVAQNREQLYERVMSLAAEADPVVYAKQLAGDKWNPRVVRNTWLDDDPRLDDDDWFWKPLKAGPVKRRVKHKGEYVEIVDNGKQRSVHYYGKAMRLDEFNPSSSQQILACLKARGAETRYMSEENGKLSANADNLRACDDALATAILDFRAEDKVLSTYVEPMIQRKYDNTTNSYKEPFIAPDGRIHATYRQVGARTGRMSCADPNMQNQPRDDLRLRYNIRAEPGHKLIACDLSNIEMFLFVAYCGRGRLWDALAAGEDLHELTARMLGFRDRARAGGTYESARQQGKVYNFTTIYGGGLRSIKRYFRCSIDEARLYKQRYAAAFPEVTDLQERISHAVHSRGYLQDALISGRRFRVSADEDYKGTNYLVQGTAAALLKYAVNRLHEDGVPMVALVHDEILAHVLAEEAEATRALMIERMTYHPELSEQFPIPLKAEGDIVDRWSDAKPLTEQGTGRKYLFDPAWADVPRRYLDQAVEL